MSFGYKIKCLGAIIWE